VGETRNLQRRAEFLLQNTKNGSSRHIFALLFIACRLENVQKTLFCDGNLLELQVALHDFGVLLGIEIGLLASLQGLHRLGVELLVVDALAHVDGTRQFHTHEL